MFIFVQHSIELFLYRCAAIFNNKKKSMETTKETYEAPLCTVIEVEPVQVICSSGTGSHQGFDEDDYSYGW